MPAPIKPTSRQKSILVLHFIIFAIATVIMWTTYSRGVKGWAYPWPAWITAAWGLWLMGHFCVVFFSTEDKGEGEYKRQQAN
jgi:hypothetical protein